MVHMIAYQDGMEMKVGDSVLIEDGSTPGVITELIESVSEQSQSNVDEPGIMIKSPPFGLVLIPVSTFKEDPVVLVQRVES
jgi:hypothetical protein